MYSSKRSLVLFLLIFCVLLSACVNQQTDNTEESDHTQNCLVKTERIYPFEPGYTISGIAMLDQSLLVAAADEHAVSLNVFSLESGYNGIKLSFDKELILDDPKAANETLVKAVCTNNDYYYVLLGEIPRCYYDKYGNYIENEEYQGQYALLCYSLSGELIRKTIVSDFPYDNITGLAVCSDGKTYVYSSNYIVSLAADGSVSSSFVMDDGIELLSAEVTELGLIISCYNYVESCGSYYTLDFDSDELSRLPLKILCDDGSWSTGNTAKTQTFDNSFLICDALCFFRYEPDSRSCDKLMKWGSFDQYDVRYDCVCQVAENRYICSEKANDCLTLIWSESIPETAPTIVNVAICGDRAQEMQGRVERFDASSGEYDYRFTIYSQENIDHFITELSAGRVPDLVLFDTGLNTNSQYFEDLYPLIDADPDLSRDAFLPNYLQAIAVKGELHELWTGIRIQAVLANQDYTPLMLPESLDTLFRTVEQDSDISLFPLWLDMASYVTEIGCAEFVDRSTGQCSFTDPSFRDLLLVCKAAHSLSKDEDSRSILIPQTFPIVSFVEQSLHREDGNWVFASIPGLPSGGNYFLCGAAGRCAAIPRGSDNKEGAWAYIKSELTLSAQLSQAYNMPVILEAFKREIAGQLSEETAEKLLQLILSITKAKNYSDQIIYESVFSGVQSYFHDEIPLEEAIERIQDRALIYTSEQYG